MPKAGNNIDINKISAAGLLVTLGIVFGNIGTSPLYTMSAVLNGGKGNFGDLLVYGSLSCIFWTLTLTTTIKHIAITLRADNNGEGGIFALFALMKNKSVWVAVLTMIGGGALLADAIITPSITVTSAIEGLELFNPKIPVVPIVLVIIAALFFIQQFGTHFIGSYFGPVILVWFLMLGLLGLSQIISNPLILGSLNPVYAYRFLSEFPGGFVLLGAVFLCTTGVETIYVDLGHCGRNNIRVSWIFVKISLMLNYMGQGAWLLQNYKGGEDLNPFFEIMPEWLLLPGIVIATTAAIIASQSIISGSFTLVSEAALLNFWPRLRVLHPTLVRGQVYMPFVNMILWIACTIVVLIFKKSGNMDAAYVLAITITEIATTLLLAVYLFQKGVNHRLISFMVMVYLTVEGSFLIANLFKFSKGGWFTLILGLLFILIMLGWYFGRKIKNRYISFANLNKYTDLFRDLSQDESVPKTATNLVYIIRANRKDQVESKVVYSIFSKFPKRADKYWLLHIDRVNEPNQFEYQVTQIIPGILIRVDFHIGFKVEPSINLYFREVLEDLSATGEIKLESGYESLRKYDIPPDFKFILIERIMPRDYKLSNWENFILFLNNIAGKMSISDIKALQLDATNTVIEHVPIIIDQPSHRRIQRMKEI
ncbi:MAG TPA: KUP/HAK/KT family potassium transporter [Bacteroidales bacterium]|jgi:KUP system potassium uptake protein|nr:potassium transporter Kup [Bacteroidales bacterium]HNR41633.1 KUP/HAK/KT family potassium transporter [Bacteroidales bacterium]HQG77691.1 KUP/HAK/KT family potassium transporter [Bacteroidales bacterium]